MHFCVCRNLANLVCEFGLLVVNLSVQDKCLLVLEIRSFVNIACFRKKIDFVIASHGVLININMVY